MAQVLLELMAFRRPPRISELQSSFMRVLVIEDDTETAAYVVEGLKTGGHSADQCV